MSTSCSTMESHGSGTATGDTPMGAVKAAINLALAAGNGMCGMAVCSGLNQQCGYVPTAGTASVQQIQTPDGTMYQAHVDTRGKCECQTVAPGT